MHKKQSKVKGVLVTYSPDETMLKSCVCSLIEQLDKLFIVNNSPVKPVVFEELKKHKIEIIHLSQNMGIAYAQNIGIKKAIEEGAEFILLSDQDTIYPENYVYEMLKCFEDEKVAAAGPMFVDTHTGERQLFVVIDRFKFKKMYPQYGKHEVSQLIASGTIIKVSALKDIGLMREDFFIDWVDMEWCWRAIKKGYKLIGNADVVIYHQHGEKSSKLLKRHITLKKPWRYYYTIRNGIYLSLHSDLLNPFLRFILFLKVFRNALVYPILTEPHFQSLRYSLLGLLHGIIGKLGKLEDGSH